MQRIKEPRSPFIRKCSRWFVGLVSQSIARVSIFGKENLPANPPYIAVGNHFGNFEPPMMIRAINHPIDFLASGDIPFEGHVAWGPWIYGYIPTRRLSASPGALKAAIRTLRNGGIVGLFPEGRADRNVIRPPKPGTAYMACSTGAPVVPIGFSGLDRLLFSLLKGVRPTVYVLIGKPVKFPMIPSGHPQKKEILHNFGMRIMKRVAALVDPDHRGEFSSDPLVLKWDTEWGWKSRLGDFRLHPLSIDYEKMKNEEVPEGEIPHRTVKEVLKSFLQKRQDL